MPSHSTTKKRIFRRLKQFRCDGYGDCDMVFSRSEHLARHIRKHTGEKPFKCEYPSCTKQFSRFDNMRQHAQTHQKTKNKSKQSIEDNSNNDKNNSTTTNLIVHPVSFETGKLGRPSTLLLPPTAPSSMATPRLVNDGNEPVEKFSDISYMTCNSNNESGLVSPVSMSGSFEEQGKQIECDQDLHRLTQDELDALDALNQFRQSPQAIC
ncbi:uncharacterized protein BX664DRAFT_334570 [Halteromyces radiatus]|uniref:uncharacterized protein n=1 Tax=Halteromyces radiatus TaxID=101107 RepID=UPI00221F79F8|nr:uncharacterized protein BX664DRAFT_334570 [Halteromyces radiatus]KAI8090048.1 hypothetical protein BX664DRAFT_334570 [Halteromyces radiatus]